MSLDANRGCPSFTNQYGTSVCAVGSGFGRKKLTARKDRDGIIPHIPAVKDHFQQPVISSQTFGHLRRYEHFHLLRLYVHKYTPPTGQYHLPKPFGWAPMIILIVVWIYFMKREKGPHNQTIANIKRQNDLIEENNKVVERIAISLEKLAEHTKKS